MCIFWDIYFLRNIFFWENTLYLKIIFCGNFGMNEDWEGKRIWKEGTFGMKGDLEGRKEDFEGRKEDLEGRKEDSEGIKEDFEGRKEDLEGRLKTNLGDLLSFC